MRALDETRKSKRMYDALADMRRDIRVTRHITRGTNHLSFSLFLFLSPFSSIRSQKRLRETRGLSYLLAGQRTRPEVFILYWERSRAATPRRLEKYGSRSVRASPVSYGKIENTDLDGVSCFSSLTVLLARHAPRIRI